MTNKKEKLYEQEFLILYNFGEADQSWKVLEVDGKQILNRIEASDPYAECLKAGWGVMMVSVIKRGNEEIYR